MKKKLLLIITCTVFACTINAQTKTPEWKEEKQFHTLMSTTFHPAEEGNYKPLKAKADSLLIASKLWATSTIPSNYKPSETKEQLSKLVAQCATIQKAINAKQTDARLKELITEAHEIFHKIVGECKKTN